MSSIHGFACAAGNKLGIEANKVAVGLPNQILP